jgi:hypothetical protein
LFSLSLSLSLSLFCVGFKPKFARYTTWSANRPHSLDGINIDATPCVSEVDVSKLDGKTPFIGQITMENYRKMIPADVIDKIDITSTRGFSTDCKILREAAGVTKEMVVGTKRDIHSICGCSRSDYSKADRELLDPKQRLNWRTCSNCSGPGSKSRCSGCNLMWYCCRSCQKAHWKEHKYNCKNPPMRKNDPLVTVLVVDGGPIRTRVTIGEKS